MTHTPGPWTFRPLMGTDEHIAEAKKMGLLVTKNIDNDGSRTVMGPERPMAKIPMQREGVKKPDRWNSDDPERDANARLIAAAPELLEALKGALPFIGYSMHVPDVIGRVERAIAKAEGK